MKNIIILSLFLIGMIFISGCTQPANNTGSNSNPTSSNQSNVQSETKVAVDLSSNPNCPPQMIPNPTLTTDLDLDNPVSGYGSGLEQLGIGYSQYFSSNSGCSKGSNAGQNLNDYYCGLYSPCFQLNKSDGTIEGYGKVKYVVDYQTLNVTHWTEYNQKIDFTYNWYNITLRAKDCNAVKILKNTEIDCMEASFS